MAEFTVQVRNKAADEPEEAYQEKDIKLLNFVPPEVGKETQKMIPVNLSADDKGTDIESEGIQADLEEAREYLVEEMLDRSPGVSLSVSDLAYSSMKEISEYYWKKMQGVDAKKSDSESDDT